MATKDDTEEITQECLRVARARAMLDANKVPDRADYIPLGKRKGLLFDRHEMALDVDDFFEREILPAMKKVHTKRMKQERRKHRHGH